MVWTYAKMIFIIYVVWVAQKTIAFNSRFSISYAKKSPKYKMICLQVELLLIQQKSIEQY